MKTEDKVHAKKFIYQTLEYDKFSSLEGQPLKRAKDNASKLSKEISATKGNYIPIIVNENYEVIDGNTRLEACRALGLRVIYEIVSSKDMNSLELMKHMNVSNTPWNIENFIDFYSLGYKIDTYNVFKKFLKSQKYSIAILSVFDKNINQEAIKNGKLRSINYGVLEGRLDILSKVITIVGGSIPSVTNTARSLSVFMGNSKFSESRMIKSLEVNWTKVLKSKKMNIVIGQREISSILQKCYNYGYKNKIRLFEDEL